MKTVRDIMATDVIGVSPEATVHELAQTLAESQISGVPVLNSQRELVGVVSAADIVRLASAPVEPQSTWVDTLEDTVPDYVPSFFRDAGAYTGKWTALAADQTPPSFHETTVKEIMTSVPFTVPADTSVSLLAQFLAERRIHRAIVTDRDGLAGIVTTFDVLRACHSLLAEEVASERHASIDTPIES